LVLETVTYYFINFTFTTWKKYLQEKFWSKKEKLSRVKTWARKHEKKVTTIKGFYIPPTIPQTDQAKFFQQKRDLDEQWIWDEELLRKQKKNVSSRGANLHRDITFNQSIGWKVLKKFKFRQLFAFSTQKRVEQQLLNWNFLQTKITHPFSALKSKKSSRFLKFKFSKKFLKSAASPFFIWIKQHLWSYSNIGLDTNEFLNFFYIQHFPPYLVHFGFLKSKVLFLKHFKNFLNFKMRKLSSFTNNKNLLFNDFLFFFKKNNLNQFGLDHCFFFLKVFKNWYSYFSRFFFFKNFIVFSLLKSSDEVLLNLVLKKCISIILRNFSTLKKTKKNLYTILLSKLVGASRVFFKNVRSKKKNSTLTDFYFSSALFFCSKTKKLFEFFEVLQLNSLPLIFSEITGNILSNPLLFFIELLYTNFDSVINLKDTSAISLQHHFFKSFSFSGLKSTQYFYLLSHNFTMRFFVFLRNRIRHYDNVKLLLFKSFNQQVNLDDDINVADVLFKYIIRKGKKLTARIVFLKFLRKFKKKYALPGLAIFTHALLSVEPRIWLKKKKIAGRVYEIPIYISASWSKRIAVRWLLQAAKKRKRASITDSLALEVWDACFRRGGAYNNKESTQLLAHWNKAYLRWL
jgi:small subunit ribosomal protein S7